MVFKERGERAKMKCKEHYDYVIKKLERYQSNNVSFHVGEMLKRCFAYFERRGIKVTKEPLGLRGRNDGLNNIC